MITIKMITLLIILFVKDDGNVQSNRSWIV
jgi:hypothetical protein